MDDTPSLPAPLAEPVEIPPVPKAPLRTQLKDRLRRFGTRAGTFWADVRPTREARIGALALSGLLTVLYVGYMGGLISPGLGPVLDALVFALAIGILLFLGAWAIQCILWVVGKVPRFAAGFMATEVMLLGIIWPQPSMPVAIVVANGLLGGAAASLLFGGFSRMALSRRIITLALVVLGVAADAAILILLFGYQGSEEGLAAEAKLPRTLEIQAPNPGEPGPLAVRALFYGSGEDKHRPEYGKGAQIKTASVDGAKIIKDKTGMDGWFRTHYWGFKTSKLPLNARVWYPDGAGPYPLVLIVHGNHNGPDYSDPGYEYLGRLLGSRGFIVASIDENFLNFDFAGDYQTAEQPARGWLLLEHLRLWHEWNRTAGNPFRNKVDLSKIALIGHSRGGEAVATAAEFNRLPRFPGDGTMKFNYHYSIQALIAIAPSDGQYMPAGMFRTLKDVNYFVIQGGHDSDVSSFMGSRQYQRTGFTEGSPCFKAELYIYRANHGQFNTVWGRTDYQGPAAWLLNLKPLISGEDQRKIAKVYFSAFLEATLRGRREYVPMFSDYRRAGAWLPDTIYANRYQDATFRPVAGFDEDYDLTTTTAPGGAISGDNLAVWKEQRIQFRHWHRENNGVYLGWRKPEAGKPAAAYTIALGENFAATAKLDGSSVLEFAMADAGEAPPPPEEKKDGKKADAKKPEAKKPDARKPKEALDFTVEVETKSGAKASFPASRFGPLHAELKARFVKNKFFGGGMGGKESEPVLQRYALPLSSFPGVDPAALKAIRFRFDRSAEGVVIIDDVGFSRR